MLSPALQEAYADWMERVRWMNEGLAVVSDLGLQWYLTGKFAWEAHKILPYNKQQAVSFDARGNVHLVGIDLLSKKEEHNEILGLSSFPKEVIETCFAAKWGRVPTNLKQLMYRMWHEFPVLAEVWPKEAICERCSPKSK